ncbi:MAG TPA: adenylate/guanylate cyclase domain-containing protein [Acidimicrobiales bacterium]|nr:adenylate/guanylate cyclase domain-containing protein [Acidimicrobiales bacterium]
MSMDRPDTNPDGGLTIDQLADATGIAPEVLREWRALGLLTGAGNRFDALDIERVRLITFVERRGITAEAIAAASKAQGDMLGDRLDMLPGRDLPRLGRPVDEAAQAVGLTTEVVRQLWSALGLDDQPEAYDEDIEALGRLRVALDAGLPETALTQIVRVFADAAGRIAEAESRLFHYYVHERFRAHGLTGTDLTTATATVAEPLIELIEPTLLYFHSKAWERAQRDDLLVHLTEDTTTPGEVPGNVEATILFVDLSGFTPLTEAMGDPAAASLVERFSHLVRAAAGRHHGTVVKQIGDEFMLVFTDPTSAVSCGLAIEAAVCAEPQFPAVRQGAHTGRVLYREGDYIGATVNVAARVAAEADRHQLLITPTLRAQATDLDDVTFTPIGARTLKGIAHPIELFDVHPTGDRPLRVIDPVCLMELDPAQCEYQLTWRGTQLYFCSQECLTRFVAAPETHRAPPPP